MPLYEYQCDACGNQFEKIQKFSDPPVDVCPSCGGSVKKLVSSPAFQFKGTGWYVTDYAKPSGGGDGGKGAKDSQEGSSGKFDGGASAEKSEKTEKSGKAEAASETKKADKPSEAKPKA